MKFAPLLAALVLLCACSGSNFAASSSSPLGISALPESAPAANTALKVPAGFTLSVIAKVATPHGLAFLPNGDLLVGSGGSTVSLVPQADGVAGAPHVFATLPDSPSYGVAFGGGSIYVSTQFALWQIRYRAGEQTASGTTKIAVYRQGPIAPHSDGDVHRSASVAVDGTHVFVGIGSSCNACVEVDPTRATVQRADLDGKGLTTVARRLRNAMALAVNPEAEALWAGGAGQDSLPIQHPYEFLDSVTLHPGTPDYGWPECEENRHAYTAGANCASIVTPRIELPAYSTIMGATFYPAAEHGRYAFPARYRGGLFISAHGSWHLVDGHLIPPHVVFVPMKGNSPATPVDWNDPTRQWSDFLSGFQDSANSRIGRPTGVTVGPNGSLFVSDDLTGNIYRIRPT